MSRREQQRKLLDDLAKEYSAIVDVNMEATVFTAEELEAPMDMLRVLVTEYGSAETECLGEFYFSPDEYESEIMLFSGVLTFTMNLDPQYVPTLAQGLVKLNFLLPCGGFAIDPTEKILSYRLSQICEASASKESLLLQTDSMIRMAFAAPEQYVGMLLKMAEGGISLDELSVLFPEEEG